MSEKATVKKYNIEIQKKSIKIIILIFFLINFVFFLIGFFVGKAANIKKINDNLAGKKIAEEIKTDTQLLAIENDTKILAAVANDTKTQNITNIADYKKSAQQIEEKKTEKSKETKTSKKSGEEQKKTAPSKSAAKKTVSKPKQEKFYTLEIYSYKTQREAEQFKDILKVRGLNAYIHKTESPRTGTLYKIRYGKFDSREKANNEGKRLENKGIIPNFYILEYN
ncbi:MAG TPA: SPOR domain-containing protein [bacterium]|nr:SPOR domain-containing protein [bacterium]HPP86639.1 SPOR domain-containing protein [bacterium]